MRWTCEQVEARLSEYVDGLLGPNEQAEFNAHARTCERCAPLLARVTNLVKGLRNLEMVAEPPALVSQILDGTLGPRRARRSWRAVIDSLGILLHPKLVYGSVSVVVTLAIVLSTLGPSWHRPKLADLYPPNLYHAANRQVHLVYAHGVKFVSDLRVVYEIQSRLRPETDVQPAPENTPPPQTNPATPPGTTLVPETTRPRQQNRAIGLSQEFALFASVLPRASERSLP